LDKVLAYITRERSGRSQLLVFQHRDFPAAGVQVPAGTVEAGEAIEAALWREVEEESGLRQLSLVGKVATQEVKGNRRHFFHLRVVGELPDAWDWTTNDYHDDEHRDRGEPLIFRFYWADLSSPPELAGGQGAWLHLVR
jgi:8-oxo-dGTP pyrophosphatase MutT (NUDIX family)